MAKQTVGRTALGAAICRLIEQYQPEGNRLFNDQVVKELVGNPIRVLMRFASIRKFTVKQTDAVTQGLYGAQICRTRYIDDAVQAALSQGIEQFVILGAGLDTRPYRLPGLDNRKVFEVDLASVQEDKKKKIAKHIGGSPQHVTFVPIDFDTQSLETVLAETTFDASKPAMFIWEGVTQYITEEAVRRTLAFVGTSARGSIIVFTYVLKSIIERQSDIPGADHMMDVIAKSAPWLFGLEPANVASFLNPFHLVLQAVVGNACYQENYLKPIKRNLVVSEVERVVLANVK
jgi:methyltransferase (TIGR00027 family)